MTSDVSLKELMEEKFRNLDARIYELRLAVEKLAENTVAVERFESTTHKVVKLQQSLEDLDDRMDKAEGYIGIWRYISAALMTVILALLIGWLSGWMGV